MGPPVLGPMALVPTRPQSGLILDNFRNSPLRFGSKKPNSLGSSFEFGKEFVSRKASEAPEEPSLKFWQRF